MLAHCARWYAQARVPAPSRFWEVYEHAPHAICMPIGRYAATGRKGIAVIQASDTPTSQSTAARWTFYRRFGLLLRTRLDDEGSTLSLHDIAVRTRGRVSADDLMTLLRQSAQAEPDAVTCVILAQAFDIDPDFFVTDQAVQDYIDAIRSAHTASQPSFIASSLQIQALAARNSARLTAAIAD